MIVTLMIFCGNVVCISGSHSTFFSLCLEAEKYHYMALSYLSLARQRRKKWLGQIRLTQLLYGFVALCLVNCAWLLLTPRSLPEQLRSGGAAHVPELIAGAPLAYTSHLTVATRVKTARKPDEGVPQLRRAPSVPAASTGNGRAAASNGLSAPHAHAANHEHEDAAPLLEPWSSRLRVLRSLPALLSRERLAARGPISCGGSGVVVFKQWEELSRAGAHLPELLPERSYPPAAVARAVAATPCYWARTHDAKCKGLWERELQAEGWDKAGAGNNSTVAAWGTCAVVANGGRLRHEVHGTEIDASDVVIRFNQGKTQGFEKEVGTKSTFRLFNGPYVEAKQPGEICVAQVRDLALRAWVGTYLKHPGAAAFLFDPEFLCHTWEWVARQGEKPSSGLVGILFALAMCARVDVYGFEYGAYFNSSSQPHYYDWERPKPGREGVHPFAKEFDLYLLLQSTGLVSMH
eukprot:jgi/Mesvir1/17392/Mv08690-RA.1